MDRTSVVTVGEAGWVEVEEDIGATNSDREKK